jgi:hypothetical protein
MPAASTMNEQDIEAVVSGPGGANRLYTCRGQAVLGMQLFSNQNKRETWTFLVGPVLPQRFLRGTASVSVASYATFIEPQTSVDPQTGIATTSLFNLWYSLDFQSVEADWDDESGRTEMRVEIQISTGSIHYNLAKIGYEATVLAEAV